MTDRVYNSTDGPLLIDRAGRTVGGREHSSDDLPVDVSAQPAKGHVEAGRLIVVDASPADETTDKPADKGRAPKEA